jgi:uncharacterized cysteine cluster protein YcgN (CxxCxxCC family)
MSYISIIKHKEGHVMKNEKKEMKFRREIVEKYVNRVGRAGFMTVYPGERWNVQDLKDVISGKIKEAAWFKKACLYKEYQAAENKKEWYRTYIDDPYYQTRGAKDFLEAVRFLEAVEYLRENVTKKRPEILIFLRSSKREISESKELWTWDGTPHITGYKEGGAE